MLYEFFNKENNIRVSRDFALGECPEEITEEHDGKEIVLRRVFSYGIGQVPGAGGSPAKSSRRDKNG